MVRSQRCLSVRRLFSAEEGVKVPGICVNSSQPARRYFVAAYSQSLVLKAVCRSAIFEIGSESEVRTV